MYTKIRAYLYILALRKFSGILLQYDSKCNEEDCDAFLSVVTSIEKEHSVSSLTDIVFMYLIDGIVS